MGHHEGHELVFLNDPLRKLEDFRGGPRVQGGGMLVQEEELRLSERGHQQGQGLPLAAGKEADFGRHPVFQAQAQLGEQILIAAPLFPGDPGLQGPALAAPEGQGEVFFDLHRGGRAEHRILEDPAEQGGPPVLGHTGDIRSVDDDAPAVHRPDAGDRVEQGGLSGAVAADDGHEIPVVQAKADIVQGDALVDGLCIEGFGNVGDLKHWSGLLCAGASRRSSPSRRGWPGRPQRSGRKAASAGWCSGRARARSGSR